MGDNQWLLDNFDVAEHNLATQWGDLVLGQISGFDDLDDTLNNYLQASSDLSGNISQSWTNWNNQMEYTFELAGKPMEEFAETTAEYLDEVTEKTDAAAEASQNLADTAVEAYDTALDALKTFAEQYEEKMKPVIEANQTAEKSILNLLTAYNGLVTAGILKVNPDGSLALPDDTGGESPTGMATGGYTGA